MRKLRLREAKILLKWEAGLKFVFTGGSQGLTQIHVPFSKRLGAYLLPKGTPWLCKGCHAIITAFCSPALGVGAWGSGWGHAPHCSSQVKLHTGEVCEPWQRSLSSLCRWIQWRSTRQVWVQDTQWVNISSTRKSFEWMGVTLSIFSSKTQVPGLSAAFSQSVCVLGEFQTARPLCFLPPVFPRVEWALHCTCSSKLWHCIFFKNNENN